MNSHNNKIKVLMISTVGLIYDGITNVILTSLKAMDLTGLDIYIAGTVEVQPDIRYKIEQLGCTVVDFPNRRTRTFNYALELSGFIHKNGIQVVHAHGNSKTLAIEMFAAWMGGCPRRIAHSHNTRCEHVMADKILRPLFYATYTEALACGEEAGRWLFGKHRFVVLANGRDHTQFQYSAEARDKIRCMLGLEKEIAIGHVGGFVEQKNHRFIIQIYREIRKICPRAKLYLIGDGPLKKKIEMEAAGLDINFVGSTDRVEDYLQAMDGMVLPSLYEGLPLVMIEWQLNGLPVVLSDSITTECVFADNVRCLSLEEPPIVWAQVILYLISTNNRSKSSSTNCELSSQKGFNISESVNLLRKLYIT